MEGSATDAARRGLGAQSRSYVEGGVPVRGGAGAGLRLSDTSPPFASGEGLEIVRWRPPDRDPRVLVRTVTGLSGDRGGVQVARNRGGYGLPIGESDSSISEGG